MRGAAGSADVERGVVGVVAGVVVDAHRNRLARGDADQALAQRHLGADAGGRIAEARQRVERAAGFVEHRQQRVADAEAVRQRAERAVREAGQVVAGTEVGDGFAQLQQRVGRRRRRQQARVDVLDVEHAIDIGAAQRKHLGHAAARRDAGELGLHVFEQRAGGFGAQIVQLQAEMAEAAWAR
jgi:hypothetical protein